MKRDVETTIQAWLSDAGSFMQRLKAHGVTDAKVYVLKEGFAVPRLNERARLAILPHEKAWIRDVKIASGDTVWMTARTVIPQKTLTGREKQLQRLKNHSLGSFLFKDRFLKREFTFKKSGSFWLRRSFFLTRGKILLLIEKFYPSVWELS